MGARRRLARRDRPARVRGGGEPVAEAFGRRRHRDERQDHDCEPRPARARGMRRAVRARLDDRGRRASARVFGPRSGAQHDARPGGAPGDLPRLGGRRLPGRRDGGVVARARAAPRGRHALRLRRLHEPDAGPPRLPPDDGGLLRRQAPALPGARAARGRRERGRRMGRPPPRRATRRGGGRRPARPVVLRLHGRLRPAHPEPLARTARLGVRPRAPRRSRRGRDPHGAPGPAQRAQPRRRVRCGALARARPRRDRRRPVRRAARARAARAGARAGLAGRVLRRLRAHARRAAERPADSPRADARASSPCSARAETATAASAR